MEQEATEDIQLMAGMTPSDKPYLRTGITEMWKNRIPWLMFLMLSATFTSMILTSFEDRLAVQTVLIAFIPMLMGTGGNSGAQASTAVIRSLSLGDVEPKDVLKVMWKEWRVALLCGLSKVRECGVRTVARKPPYRYLLAFARHPAALQVEEGVVETASGERSAWYRELTQAFYLEKN
jgi:Mg/Co/Ni transporter MgtE